MQAFVPKNRKPKFEFTLKIIDLNNIPLVCGTAYVRWHLPSSTSAEHRGRTDKALIREHKATWDYEKRLSVQLLIDKNQALQESDIYFEILQEYHEGGRGRVVLGNVKLNLSEYCDSHEIDERERDRGDDLEDDGGITRRYLMQDSKINSTLKIGIQMRQTEGETNFSTPPLKSAMVFGGIAGIVSAETGDGDETMPSISSKTRELSELQDVYRRTLAATWACQAGELPPDKLVEDLFAGGNGGRMDPPKLSGWDHYSRTKQPRRDEGAGSSTSDSESRRAVTASHLRPSDAGDGHKRFGSKGNHGNIDGPVSQRSFNSNMSGRGSIDQQVQQSHHKSDGRREQGSYRELSEFDVREDLRSWQIKAR